MSSAGKTNTVYLTGDDTIILNGNQFSDFGHDEVGKLTYPTDIMTMRVGKTGNAIIAANASGEQATLELKLLRGGGDDALLNQWLVAFKANPSAATLLIGSVTKNVGVSNAKTTTPTPATVTHDIYTLAGGMFAKNPEVTVHVSGDVEQAIVVYTFHFASATRTIG